MSNNFKLIYRIILLNLLNDFISSMPERDSCQPFIFALTTSYMHYYLFSPLTMILTSYQVTILGLLILLSQVFIDRAQ